MRAVFSTLIQINGSKSGLALNRAKSKIVLGVGGNLLLSFLSQDELSLFYADKTFSFHAGGSCFVKEQLRNIHEISSIVIYKPFVNEW